MNVIAPLPSVKLEFHVEPHPDPVVRGLIQEVERLRRINDALVAKLIEMGVTTWP